MADQREEGVPLTGKAVYDQDLYGGGGQTPYLGTAMDDDDAQEDQQDVLCVHFCLFAARMQPLTCIHATCRMAKGPTAARGLHGDLPEPDSTQDEPFDKKSIYEREDDYRRRRLDRVISPARNDAFAMGDKTPDSRVRTYADIMREQQVQREMENTMRNIADKKKQEADLEAAAPSKAPSMPAAKPAVGEKRRNRWDQSTE